MKSNEDWAKATFGYEFADNTLLARALTHRSAAGENNERLEFLGDAVLDFVISAAVFQRRPNAREGELSRLRATLVRDTTLAEMAAVLDVGERMVLGSGEKKSGGHRRESILADALEALFGAIYLDSGFESADTVIRTLYRDRLDNLPDADTLKDPKTRLQEHLQARGLGLPRYATLRTSGKAHEQRFEVSCQVETLAKRFRGEGGSRREAEQRAATLALEALGENGSE